MVPPDSNLPQRSVLAAVAEVLGSILYFEACIATAWEAEAIVFFPFQSEKEPVIYVGRRNNLTNDVMCMRCQGELWRGCWARCRVSLSSSRVRLDLGRPMCCCGGSAPVKAGKSEDAKIGWR
jgi:hypothetical protein